MPVWTGELYFEMHRGTLTRQSATKVGNRRCERLLREAELWWVAAGGAPPHVAAEIDALWKEVLLQQFHDIIPGSSIAWVQPTPRPLTLELRIGWRRSSPTRSSSSPHPAHRLRTRRHTPDARSSTVDGEPVLIEVPGLGDLRLGAVSTDDHPVVLTDRSMNNGLIAAVGTSTAKSSRSSTSPSGRQLAAGGQADHARAGPRPSRGLRRVGPRVVDAVTRRADHLGDIDRVRHASIRCWPS